MQDGGKKRPMHLLLSKVFRFCLKTPTNLREVLTRIYMRTRHNHHKCERFVSVFSSFLDVIIERIHFFFPSESLKFYRIFFQCLAILFFYVLLFYRLLWHKNGLSKMTESTFLATTHTETHNKKDSRKKSKAKKNEMK